MKIAVIGSGYVGLVTGACLAEIGHNVVCCDNDESKIRTLNEGKLPIYELHLDDVVARNHKDGRIQFTSDVAGAVRQSKVVFICVGTPPLDNGDADLSAIDRVARLIAEVSEGPKLVVTFQVASNPEFLREGTAVSDFLHPDRIVIGVDNGEAEKQLRQIYQPILDQSFRCAVHQGKCPSSAKPPFVVTTINSAELIKHASNSFLAMKISYANAIADLCDKMGANVQEVTRAMGMDPRIGPQFLNAGLGFGGFCLPKDIQAFIRLAERASVDFSILKEAERLNKRRIDLFLERAHRSLWVMKDKQVGVLGLAFKANTDDIRFSPAMDVVRRLLAEGAKVTAFDPEAMGRAKAEGLQVQFATDASAVAEKADALMILTEWSQFRELDWKGIKQRMARPLLFDGRNLLDPAQMKALGFEYHSVGRP
ncbi:MAG: UDP-glucose/GDP-mannose dehydrogenase family protein [Acidobacteria bacterium]|nr:UDP-glucose/GDP-mannose dehydrogenase family protein [Acidobacteriota bacterium]